MINCVFLFCNHLAVPGVACLIPWALFYFVFDFLKATEFSNHLWHSCSFFSKIRTQMGIFSFIVYTSRHAKAVINIDPCTCIVHRVA
uniref:Uncharacterized protein n=1 Tax=Arundo donax TaxID=35708 RepID=A0A0A8XYW2_ARUDO